jgi:hypothetical protein
MTSRFILDEFDLDLSSPCLLLRFRFLVVVVIVPSTVDCVVVIDERVLGDGGAWRCGVGSLGLVGCWGTVSWMHVESALALAHCKQTGETNMLVSICMCRGAEVLES